MSIKKCKLSKLNVYLTYSNFVFTSGNVKIREKNVAIGGGS